MEAAALFSIGSISSFYNDIRREFRWRMIKYSNVHLEIKKGFQSIIDQMDGMSSTVQESEEEEGFTGIWLGKVEAAIYDLQDFLDKLEKPKYAAYFNQIKKKLREPSKKRDIFRARGIDRTPHYDVEAEIIKSLTMKLFHKEDEVEPDVPNKVPRPLFGKQAFRDESWDGVFLNQKNKEEEEERILWEEEDEDAEEEPALSLVEKRICDKLRRLLKKLEMVKGDMPPCVRVPTKKRARINFTPKPFDPPSFPGRIPDVQNMLQQLLDKIAEPAPGRILITGLGGLGKTTLAKFVYDSEDVGVHFDLRIWVSVCASLVDNSSINGGVIESISCREYSTLENLKLAEVNLEEILKGKRFLLVLDDVWLEHSNEWEQQFLCNLIAGDQMGSKLLLTTRNLDVPKMIGVTQRYDLDPLSDENSWSLFKTYVVGRKRLSDDSDLGKVGQKIVGLLGGFPRAIERIASLLRRRLNVKFWEEILETCQAQRGGNSDTTGLVMRVIYQHLSPELKRCLVYCSLFPRGYKLEKLNIIPAWVAAAVVLTDGQLVDSTAEKYFSTLLSISFFHRLGNKYILNDSVHDLAPHIVMNSCSRLNWLSEIPKSVTHLSMFPENLRPSELEDLCEFSCLQSLIFLHRNKSAFYRLTEGFLRALKNLRVIDLSHTDLLELPSSVGELKHLRFLNLSHTSIQSLPETLSHLDKLQVLDLLGCHMLSALPAGVNKMTSLTHLKASPDLVAEVDGIGNLASLQNLGEFKVYKREGHKIMELKNMNKLQGGLRIRNLENVMSETEAEEARLKDKDYLEKLELEWSEDHLADTINEQPDHYKILEGLKPFWNLKMISVKGYNGSTSPSWMRNHYFSSYLNIFCLKNCKRWKELPPLEYFRSLVELRLHGLLQWEGYFGVEGGFQWLSVLEIKDCPKLRTIQLPPALTELRIERVGLTTLEWRDPNYASLGPSSVSSPPPPLPSFYISDCHHLESIKLGAFKSLTLCKCKELTKLSIMQLASVKSLVVKDCPGVVLDQSTATEESSSKNENKQPLAIRNLEIRGSPGIVKKWFQLLVDRQARTSLSFLVIKDYPDMVSFKEEALQHLTALEEMSISYTNSNLSSSTSADAQCSGAAISLKYSSSKASDGDHMTSRLDVTIKEQLIQDLTFSPIIQILECLKSLKHLELSGCPNIKSLPDELVNLTVLDSLTVSSCYNLRSFKVQALPFALRSLTVKNCPFLTSFTMKEQEIDIVGSRQVSLESLVLHGCISLDGLPSNMRKLEYLKVLHIENCPRLLCLPQKGLPIFLEELVIQQCPVLTRRCQREKGKEWHKIASLPDLYKLILQ